MQQDPPIKPQTMRVMAPLLSLFVFPGLGHAVAGYPWRGVAWQAAMLSGSLLVLFLGIGDLRWLWGIPLLVGALALAVAIDVLVVANEPRKAGLGGWLTFAGSALVLGGFLVVGLPLLARVFIVEAFKIPSGGMCPTVAIGDHVFVDKRAYHSTAPALGDLVVFEYPSQPEYSFLFRIVGLPGDELVITEEGSLVRNGEPVPTAPSKGSVCNGAQLHEEELGNPHLIAIRPDDVEPGQFSVGPDEVFVMGDNRQNAADSRFRGAVPLHAIRGKVAVRWIDGRSGQLKWERVQ